MLQELKPYTIRDITPKVKKHIAGCKACCLGQTSWHKKIGANKPAHHGPLLIKAIAINFITDLPSLPRACPGAIDGYGVFYYGRGSHLPPHASDPRML